MNTYKLPPIQIVEEKPKETKKKEAEPEIEPVIAPDRAASVEMAIANLMMKYRDLMRTPGKSKTEKERDFIMLMRDKFLGMEGQPNCSLLRPINHVLSLTPNLQYSLSTDHYLLTIHSLLHSLFGYYWADR